MDDMITDQLEWLVSCNLQGNRLARHLLILSGCLAGEGLPENISRQMAALSRQVLLQDVFDALVSSLNQLGGAAPGRLDRLGSDNFRGADLATLLAQIEDARQQLSACETVNLAELVAWIVAQARDRKLWRRTRSR